MARSALPVTKAATRPGKTAANVKAAAKAKAVAPSADAASDAEDDSSNSTTDDEGSGDDDEDADVSKKGLARLMEALGEDGLSELDKAHLGLVTGAGESEEVDDEDEEDMEDDEDEEMDDDEDEEEEDEEDEEDNELLDLEAEEAEDDDSEEEEGDDDVAIPAAAPARAKAGDSLAASIARSGLVEEEEDEEDEDEEEDPEADDAIPLESLSDAALAALPESVRAARSYREKINNEDALRRVRAEIALGGPSTSKGKGAALPWIETLVVPYDKSIQELVGAEAGAADDDLKRELEFYKQALHTATQGRVLAAQANLPFTRPNDYFAEMVKSDEHMERVRQRLLDERAGLKASEEARKQRELKKFGKKVQVEKQLERQRNKREFEDKVKGFKRKRQGPDGGDSDDGGDDFDVRLESAMEADGKASRGGNTRGRGGARGGANGGNKMRRDARDAKYGFGGKKRHSKENTRESTNDFGEARSGGSRGRGGGRGGARGGRGGGRGGMSSRGGAKRPGKARRAAGRG